MNIYLGHPVQQASDDEICAICELCQNALNGSLPVSTTVLKQKLNPFKKLLRKIGRGQDSIEKKRRQIASSVRAQQGGLPLIPILAPIISSLIGSAIASQV